MHKVFGNHNFHFSFFNFQLVLITALLAGCSLDENPKSQIGEDVIYTDAQTLYQHAVATLYSYIGGNVEGEGLQGMGRGVSDLQTFGSDEAIMPRRGVDWYDGGIWQDLYRHSWSAGHEMVKNSWMYLYKVVGLCNRSLETIDTHRDLLIELQYQRYTAEVRALRAIYYWYLLDLYGRVPIVTNASMLPKDVEQAERSEVFDFVRTELEATLPYLHDAKSSEYGAYYGRVTQGVAAFVLAKLYLNAEVYTWDQWTTTPRPDGSQMTFTISGNTMNAWEACTHYCTLIDQMGYDLSDSYEENFKVYNEGSLENIWIIPMDRRIYTHQQQNLVRSMHWRHANGYGFQGSNGSSATITVLMANDFEGENEDMRFAKNYWSATVADKEGYTIYDRDGNPLRYMPWEVSIDMKGSQYLETAGARMRKYEIDHNAAQKGKMMNNDVVLFRYADVVLMMAEAYLRNGDATSAQPLLDMVRERADMPTVDATLDNIYRERLIELAWEAWRRQDMIRFDRYKSELADNAVNESDHHTIVFPIPGTVISLNNKKITQNFGY
ncbi:MAG: RagB/SusD family nutrient uptake outer membrane protein [Prevotella sp.]|nr:RagB/SusD family nutrient uptake outer membrane protein [Prevotella sp.]